ncbi:MAG: GDP-mannose 4,6-dehydratase [bacterium]
MHKRILITGSQGFVGRYLTSFLLRDKNYKIYGIDKNKSNEKSYHHQSCDITNSIKLAELIKEIEPDLVIHLVAVANPQIENKKLVYDVNVGGTKNLLQALSQSEKKTDVLLVSSAYVYGSSEVILTEKSPTKAMGIYAESKLAMENLANEYLKSNLKIKIARPFNHTGPGQTTEFVVPSFSNQIAQIEAGILKPVIKVGNLEPKKEMLDVRDVVRAYRDILLNGKAGEVYNIARGEGYTIKDLLNRLLSLSKVKISIENDPAMMRTSDIMCLVGSPKKIYKETSWQAQIDIMETLKETLQYFRRKI